jgi:hypothetical protein
MTRCLNVQYGFNCSGQVIPQGRATPGPCLFCGAETFSPCLIDADDDFPPWLGERMRQTTYDIHRAAAERAQDEEDHHV